MASNRIILAADHAGFKLKEVIKAFLIGKGFNITDVGALKYVEGDDYPEYMVKAATEVSRDLEGNTKAILFGLSGQGEAMVANRFPGVRAAVYYGGKDEIVTLSREHNDANAISLGAKFIDEAEAKRIVELWLSTAFSGEERHKRRIEQIDSII